VNDYVQTNGGIVLANPNAPTGQSLPVEQVEWLLGRNPDSVLVVDEAYVDFGGDSVIPLVDRYDNLLVVRTLSKSYSLAGLRVGFAVGHPELIRALERVKNSFNSYPLDRLAIVGAAAALRDREHFETSRSAVISGREFLRTGLLDLGFEVLPSAANFVFARHSAHEAGGAICRAKSSLMQTGPTRCLTEAPETMSPGASSHRREERAVDARRDVGGHAIARRQRTSESAPRQAFPTSLG
jgi:histidinol-phosphate aminotransferase